MARKKQPVMKPLVVGQQLSTEQTFLRMTFGHGDKILFGNEESECLPKFNGVLMSGSGIIKSEDDGETGRMFGI